MEANVGAVGVHGNDLYFTVVGRDALNRTTDDLYTVVAEGGPPTLLDSTQGRFWDINVDSGRLFYWKDFEWRALGGPLLDGFRFGAESIAIDGNMIYAKGERGDVVGVWRRPLDAGAPWELLVEGGSRFDVRYPYLVFLGDDRDAHTTTGHIRRYDLRTGEDVSWAFHRDPEEIDQLFVDGDAVLWIEDKQNFRLESPMELPRREVPVEGGGFRRVGSDLYYVAPDLPNHHLRRYDETTGTITTLLTFDHVISDYVLMGDTWAVIEPMGPYNRPGAVYLIPAADPSAPATKIPVPTYSPAKLLWSDPYLYWIDQGYLAPGTVWRTDPKTGETVELASLPWPRGMVQVGDVLYIIASEGLWALDPATEQLTHIHREVTNYDSWGPVYDGTYLYWVNTVANEIWRYQPGDAQPTLLYSGLSLHGVIVLGDDYLYWRGDGPSARHRTIWRAPRDGSGSPEPVAEGVEYATLFEIVDDRFWYWHSHFETLLSLPKDGSALPTLSDLRFTELRWDGDEQIGIWEGVTLRLRDPATGETTVVDTQGRDVVDYDLTEDYILYATDDGGLYCVARGARGTGSPL